MSGVQTTWDSANFPHPSPSDTPAFLSGVAPVVSEFVPQPSHSEVLISNVFKAENRCRNMDSKGRCPGETGYIRTNDAEPPMDFAEYKKNEAQNDKSAFLSEPSPNNAPFVNEFVRPSQPSLSEVLIPNVFQAEKKNEAAKNAALAQNDETAFLPGVAPFVNSGVEEEQAAQSQILGGELAIGIFWGSVVTAFSAVAVFLMRSILNQKLQAQGFSLNEGNTQLLSEQSAQGFSLNEGNTQLLREQSVASMATMIGGFGASSGQAAPSGKAMMSAGSSAAGFGAGGLGRASSRGRLNTQLRMAATDTAASGTTGNKKKAKSSASAGVAAFLAGAIAIAPMAQAVDLDNGAQVFNGNCAACHAGGNNVIQNEKTLKKEALEAYLTGGLKPESIVYQVTNGKNAMPAFGGRLDDDEITDVAAYVYDQATNDKW